MHPPPIAIVAATASNKNSILRTSSNELLDYGRDKLDYVPKKVPQPMSGKGFLLLPFTISEIIGIRWEC